MSIEVGNGIATGCSIVDDRETAEKLKVCEKKLVDESETMNSRYSPLCRQIVASIGITATTISVGMVIGYSAILLPELQKPNSRFKVDLVINSWIASIALLPMALGCLLAGFLMDRCGRKLTILIINVPFVIGWCIISMSNGAALLLAGRAITGFCAGVFSPAGPLYLSEITDPKYRGFFLASITFNVALGILTTHFLALYCSWNVNAIVCGVFPFIGYMCTTFCGPETPSWLIRNNTQKAFEAFLWLRGTNEVANNEFQTMVDAQVESAAEAVTAEAQCDDDKRNESNAKHFYQFYPIDRLTKLIAHKPFNAPLIILSIYFFSLQFSGVNAVIFYTLFILKDSLGADTNEYVATLVIDAVRLFAALIACVVVKNVGRRTLTIFSGGSTAICLFALSFYMNLSVDNSLRNYVSIPLGLFVAYTLVISIGLMPLPWVLAGELFPLRYRSIGSALATFFNFLCFFTVVKASPIYFNIYGGSKMFLLYGMFTSIGTAFLVALLPETKNKTLQEIEHNFTSKRKHKMNRNKVQP